MFLTGEPSGSARQDEEGSTSATLGSTDNGGASSEPGDVAQPSPSSTSSRENTEPLDLPLPSFSSTYSSFVKPPSEETPMETSSADVSERAYRGSWSGRFCHLPSKSI